MFKNIALLLCVTALIACSPLAMATPIPPGTLPPGIPIATGSLAGLTLVGTLDGTFSNASIVGTTQSQVFLDPDGHYDFTIQVTSLTKGTLERVTTFDYPGFVTTDVYNVLENSNVPFLVADRSPSGDTVGSDITILTGQASDILLIKTNAISFDSLGNMGESDGITANTPAFEPLAVVPEPATGVLLAGFVLGLGGAASYRRLRSLFVPM